MAESGRDTFRCRIVTPRETVFEGQVRSLVLPGAEGKFGVLVGHTPYMAALDVGEIKVEQEDGTRFIACSGGYAEVEEGEVKVLAETAELPEQIDVERARSALKRAQNRLEERRENDVDAQRARDALRRAENRLQVAERP